MKLAYLFIANVYFIQQFGSNTTFHIIIKVNIMDVYEMLEEFVFVDMTPLSVDTKGFKL